MTEARVCARCGQPLSRFNREAVCASCAAGGTVSTATATWLNRTRGPALPTSRGAVGQLLREYRAAHGLTQAALADRLGFDQSYISKVESGDREIRDLDALRRIAEVLVLAPEDLGLSRAEFDRRPEASDAAIARSQRQWRLVREHLNHSRGSLGRAAAALYDDRHTDGSRSPLLLRGDWMFSAPVDFDDIALRWNPAVAPAALTGSEPEASAVLPLAELTRRYHRYTRAIRDLDRPALFESRASFRLLDVDASSPATPCLTFGHTTYFDMVDVCEGVAHEVAAAHLAHREVEWAALPFRRMIGDPFDLGRRPLLPSINTLTIRRDGRGGSFVLHNRSSSRVAVAGGMYHVMPAGVFQPSSISAQRQVNDFDLWRNVMREYSEEFLGNPEHDGSGGQPIEYDAVEPFRSLNAARRAGKLRIVCFGIGLDPLTLAGEILAAAVFDADAYDEIFGAMVTANAEGTLVTARDGSTVGIPFEQRNIERLLTSEPMAPAAASCLELAWRHRAVLLCA
jgi:transcriptional regulator with XRE-family HTH domain